MERLGRTLSEVVFTEGPIEQMLVARFGLDILKLIKYMHSKNRLYVDIRPDNFMLNMKEDQVYCVDFGMGELFLNPDSTHKSQVSGFRYNKNPIFLSMNCHSGSNASRRDDIEALLYVLLYMCKGTLPWIEAPSYEAGASIKSSMLIGDICNGLHPLWEAMLTVIRANDFETMPPYEWYEDQLKIIAGIN